jgi:hypothetical protein
MKPRIKKAALGKTMRVATAFTGAAAFAAAFAPGAHADTRHQAQLGAKTLTVPRLGTTYGRQPDLTAAPAISQATNCTTTPRYVHFAMGGAVYCFGHDGTGYFPSGAYLYASRICGGNNSGSYESIGGHVATFGPGTTYAHLPWPGVTAIVAIQINYNNPNLNDKCPTVTA